MSHRKLTTAQTGAILAAMTLISKVLGLVRELVLAQSYGAGSVTDAYSMALSIPNDIFAAVMLSASIAFLPVYSQRVSAQGKGSGDRLTSGLINRLWIASAAVAAAGCAFAKPLVRILAPGFGGSTLDLTVFYLRIAFVLVIFSVSKNIQMSYLEYRGVFLSQRLFGYAENFCIIAFTLLSFSLGMPKLLIAGIVAGGAVIAAGYFYVSVKNGYRHSFQLEKDGGEREILKLALPVFAGSCATHINVLVDRLLASKLAEGSVSALHYGAGLTDAMNALTIGIVATIIYPMLSKAFAEGNMQRASSLSSRAVSLCVVLMLPCSLGAAVYAKPVIRAVFERGRFGGDATEMVAAAFLFYVAGLLFGALNTVILRVYYSLRDTLTTVKVSLICVVLNIVLDLILVGPMGLGGLALSTSVSGAAGLLMRLILLEKKHPEIRIEVPLKKIAQIAAFSVIAVGISFAGFVLMGNFLQISHYLKLFVALVIAIVVYYVELLYSGAEELKLLKELFSRNEKGI